MKEEKRDDDDEWWAMVMGQLRAEQSRETERQRSVD